MDLGEQIRDVFMKLSRQDKYFLGGPPFTSEITRLLEQSKYYSSFGVKRSRTALASFIADNNCIVGYQETTILFDANPTQYEEQYLKLEGKLNYVQLKKIFVHPNYFGKGISDELLDSSHGIARENGKEWVTDVNAENLRMFYFLKKHQITPRFEWKTKKGTSMIRFGIK